MPPDRVVTDRQELKLELRGQARARAGVLVGEMREGRRPRGQSKRAGAGVSVRQGQAQQGGGISVRASLEHKTILQSAPAKARGMDGH